MKKSISDLKIKNNVLKNPLCDSL